MTKQEILDLDFVEARHKLIDLGAFLDRVARAAGSNDFRMAAFHAAIAELAKPRGAACGRADSVRLQRSHRSSRFPPPPPRPPAAAWPGAGLISQLKIKN